LAQSAATSVDNGLLAVVVERTGAIVTILAERLGDDSGANFRETG
jgi:hypothetical protein